MANPPSVPPPPNGFPSSDMQVRSTQIPTFPRHQDHPQANRLTTQQSHIHQLATSLPPPRKQNVACDACRTRKVKCHQLPGQDKCQHCQAKNYPCTHFVQQATSEKKRTSGVQRRPRGSVADSSPGPPSGSSPAPRGLGTTPPFAGPSASHASQSAASRNPTAQLLAYLLSPEDGSDMPTFVGGAGYRAYKAASESHTPKRVEDWGIVGRRLADETFRIEFAMDLVEVYFQICHTRIPLLNPTDFRTRLRFSLPSAPLPPPVPSSALAPISPALLATVLAWGAKFSEHPLLVEDRNTNGGRSRIARTLSRKAREVAEGEKIHRIPSEDNVIIALLLEPQQSHNTNDPDGFHGFWLNCAVRHLFDMQINHRSTMAGMSEESRGTMVFAWWMACLADAYSSVYFRRKPMLEDDDYNIDFYGTGNTLPIPSPDASTTQSEYLTWFAAAHAMARVARQMSRSLWKPATEADGIPFDTLCAIVKTLNEWRDEHLGRVGVPSNFEAEWDFVAAVSACSSDATYHVMWVILFTAMDDFGIREVNEITRSGDAANMNKPVPKADEMETVKAKIMEEALYGALRIAGLAAVLTSNGYLRLDPNVLHYSTYAAGTLLARLGRPEVSNCIQGLRQYGFAYEDALDQAALMELQYKEATARDRAEAGPNAIPYNVTTSSSSHSQATSASARSPTLSPSVQFNGSRVQLAEPPYTGPYESTAPVRASPPEQALSPTNNDPSFMLYRR